MDRAAAFKDHIANVSKVTAAEIERFASTSGSACDGIVFHAGTPLYYHRDDQQMPFRSGFHFLRFAPVPGPNHLLHFRAGQTPRLIRVVPADYWYEAPEKPDHPYPDVLDVTEVGSLEDAVKAIGDVSKCAYLGNDPECAKELGISEDLVEPETLMAGLDWERAFKTDYEIECIREASRIAGRGHKAVREGAAGGATERQLQAMYLEATGMLENDCPYGTIIGWDRNAATLHYETKRTDAPEKGWTLLIDAGATSHGYASDITRTYAHGSPPAAFVEMLDRMDDLERDLCAQVGPGQSFVKLHEEAHRGVGRILCDLGVCKLSPDEMYDKKLTDAFFPHGLGHHLGLQVHDVGGKQKNREGEVDKSPERFPFLRTTRPLAADHVVTIEPGLYFIPLLLDPLRADHAADFDWGMIDELIPCGGIRIEDDIRVTEDGQEDLTRELMPGHREPAATL